MGKELGQDAWSGVGAPEMVALIVVISTQGSGEHRTGPSAG